MLLSKFIFALLTIEKSNIRKGKDCTFYRKHCTLLCFDIIKDHVTVWEKQCESDDDSGAMCKRVQMKDFLEVCQQLFNWESDISTTKIVHWEMYL